MDNTLDIVIVNWNSGRQLRASIASLANARQTTSSLRRVVVVDNASSDGSAEGDFYPSSLPVTVIHNALNRGFAAACNQGAEGSKAEFLLFLNPDTVVEEDSLDEPIAFMARPENSRIGICGIQLLDGSSQITRSCSRFPTPALITVRSIGIDRLFPRFFPNHFLTEWDHSESRRVDQVMGAFFLVRRAVFEVLKGFDERFFVYFEDLDFSLRAREAGWSSYFLSTARAKHSGGGCSDQVKASRLFYWLRSRILYSYKHFRFLQATCVMLATLSLEAFSRLILAVAHKSLSEMKDTIQAYAMLIGALPEIIFKGSRTSQNDNAFRPPPQSIPGQQNVL